MSDYGPLLWFQLVWNWLKRIFYPTLQYTLAKFFNDVRRNEFANVLPAHLYILSARVDFIDFRRVSSLKHIIYVDKTILLTVFSWLIINRTHGSK